MSSSHLRRQGKMGLQLATAERDLSKLDKKTEFVLWPLNSKWALTLSFPWEPLVFCIEIKRAHGRKVWRKKGLDTRSCPISHTRLWESHRKRLALTNISRFSYSHNCINHAVWKDHFNGMITAKWTMFRKYDSLFSSVQLLAAAFHPPRRTKWNGRPLQPERNPSHYPAAMLALQYNSQERLFIFQQERSWHEWKNHTSTDRVIYGLKWLVVIQNVGFPIIKQKHLYSSCTIATSFSAFALGWGVDCCVWTWQKE